MRSVTARCRQTFLIEGVIRCYSTIAVTASTGPLSVRSLPGTCALCLCNAAALSCCPVAHYSGLFKPPAHGPAMLRRRGGAVSRAPSTHSADVGNDNSAALLAPGAGAHGREDGEAAGAGNGMAEDAREAGLAGEAKRCIADYLLKARLLPKQNLISSRHACSPSKI